MSGYIGVFLKWLNHSDNTLDKFEGTADIKPFFAKDDMEYQNKTYDWYLSPKMYYCKGSYEDYVNFIDMFSKQKDLKSVTETCTNMAKVCKTPVIKNFNDKYVGL